MIAKEFSGATPNGEKSGSQRYSFGGENRLALSEGQKETKNVKGGIEVGKKRNVKVSMVALLFLIAFIVPLHGTLTYLWNVNPEIINSYWAGYDEDWAQVYLEPWGSNSWGFRALAWCGSSHGTMSQAKITYSTTSKRVYLYGYQGLYYSGWTPWVGVVSIVQGTVPDDPPEEEGWYKPSPLRTVGKQMQIEIKYREGNYGDSNNYAWNNGAARIMMCVWFEDRTRNKELVLDLCVDEKIGWGGLAGMSGYDNYFAGVWSSSEKVPLGNRWFKVTVDLDYYLNKAMEWFSWKDRSGMKYYKYDRNNLWLHGAEFLLELINAEREAWIDYYYLSYQ